jgi:hypothetical protein
VPCTLSRSLWGSPNPDPSPHSRIFDGPGFFTFSGAGPLSIKKFYQLKSFNREKWCVRYCFQKFPTGEPVRKINYYTDIIRKNAELIQNISSSLIRISDVALFLLYQLSNEEVKDAEQKYHVIGDNDYYRLQSAARKY